MTPKINRYTLDGKYLNTYKSRYEACEKNGIKANELNNCIEKNGRSHEYMYRYYDGNTEDIEPYQYRTRKNATKVVLLFDDYLLCEVYDSVNSVCRDFDIPECTMRSNIKKMKESHKARRIHDMLFMIESDYLLFKSEMEELERKYIK